MTVGETLLKITDYPFTFSITFLILRAFNINDIFSDQTGIFLLIAGFTGTALTIVDPLGKILQNYFMSISKMVFGETEKLSRFEKDTLFWSMKLNKAIDKVTPKFKPEEENSPDFIKINWTYINSSFHTRAIELEKDKLVSMYYFLITISVAIILINSTGIFSDHYPDNFKNNTFCNMGCAEHITTISLFIVGFGILCILLIDGRKFFDKIVIVGTYLFSVGSKNVPRESIESISKFIEIGDWQTAEYWRKQIQDDLKHKRGQKEVIVKGIEKVYRPLYKESLKIEDRCNQVASGSSYPYLEINEWNAIKLESDYIYVEDKPLLQHVGDFHGFIENYDYLYGVCNNAIAQIILKHASEEFGRKISRIEYFTDKGGGDSQFRLIDCAILGMHPKEKYQGVPKLVDYDYFDDARGRTVNYKTPPSELNKFDTMWQKVIGDVEKNISVITLKGLFKEIQTKNIELKQKYLDMINEELEL